jgi:hypothetical protein
MDLSRHEVERLIRDGSAYFQSVGAAVAGSSWQWREEPVAGQRPMMALSWQPAAARTAVYLSAGVHGDEPAGPLAILSWLQKRNWPSSTACYLVPRVNDAGLAGNTRENRGGIDLNRDYREPSQPETRAHVAILKALPRMDLTLCLHEDWEAKGVYLYEKKAEELDGCAEVLLSAMARHLPVEQALEIDGQRANGGIIRKDLGTDGRDDWPEAFYLATRHSHLNYTMETPSGSPLALRVAAHLEAVETAMEWVGAARPPRNGH